MNKFRDSIIFYNINSLEYYIENSNDKISLIISKLPKIKLKKNISLTSILDNIDTIENINLLKKIYMKCEDDSHIYIFSDKNDISVNISIMTEIGFCLENILIYNKKLKNNNNLFIDNTGIILFFVKNIKRKIKINKNKNSILNISQVEYTEDYPVSLVEYLLKCSKKDKLDDNLVLDLNSVNGEVPLACIKYNLKCICFGLNKKINTRLSSYLDKVDKVKKEIKEDKEIKKDKEINIKNKDKEKLKKIIRETIKKGS